MPISSIASIAQLIRTQAKKSHSSAESKSSSTEKADNGATNNDLQSAEVSIAQQLQALSEDKRNGVVGIETLVTGIVQWKFGKSASMDPLMKDSISKTISSIMEDREALVATQKLITHLLMNKTQELK